ncbi:MAG: c-type cytochrome [Rhodocyclaceae bacterium]|nr:c-type cytochrome [Rhodocyclaceae bacterium]
MQAKLIIAATVAAAFSSTAAFADGAKLFQEKTCWSCHGKDAKTPILPAYPKIAGQNKAYIEQQMKDIKSGARANGNSAAMKGIMVIVDDADIPQLADYLSKLKP